MKSVCDFLVVLLVGTILGGFLVLVWQRGDFDCVNLGDIGGLLAGLFTMGLFILAWLAKDEWKKQQDRALKRALLKTLYSNLTQYFHDQKLTMFEMENHKRKIKSKSGSYDHNMQVEKVEINNCYECNKLIEKVILSASQCDPDIAVFDSISSVKIPYELTPDFSYKKLNNRMDLENFKMHEWQEIIEEHECSAKKAVNSINESISNN